MEDKCSKVAGGTYTPIDTATLKHTGTREGEAAFIMRMWGGVGQEQNM